MTIEEILSSISIWSVVAPLIIGLIWCRNLSVDSLLILAVVFLSTIPQLMDLPETQTDKLVKSIAYNIYTPCEFILLAALFRNKILTRPKMRIFNITIILYCIGAIFTFDYYGIKEDFISALASANNFIYTCWIMLLLLEQYELDKPFPLNFKTPFFWYAIGLFFYSVCTILIFVLWYNLEGAESKSAKIIIHSIFNINMYIMFMIGILKDIGHKRKHLSNTAITR